MKPNETAAPPLVMHEIAEGAAIARISPRYLHMRIAAGTGPEVTRFGRRVLIRDDRLRKWIDEQTEGPTMGTPDAAKDSAALAAQFEDAIRCYMKGDFVRWAQIVNGSKFPVKMFAAAGFNVVARLAEQADDPEQFLELVAEVIRRD